MTATSYFSLFERRRIRSSRLLYLFVILHFCLFHWPFVNNRVIGLLWGLMAVRVVVVCELKIAVVQLTVESLVEKREQFTDVRVSVVCHWRLITTRRRRAYSLFAKNLCHEIIQLNIKLIK